MLAPICLFTYNRLNETQRTVEALKCNYLASQSELYIYSDGPKNVDSNQKVNDVRNYLKGINGFKSVEIIESPSNKGLANSVITGVSEVIAKFGKIIVLEDDLISAPNFLNFMNQALDFYQENPKIFSISGYTLNLPSLKTYKNDVYLGYRASSWGWATWKDRWENVDWEVKDYPAFKWNVFEHIRFMRAGSDMPRMLWKQMHGILDSWAIRWCYYQFKKDMLTVYPSKSKIINNGIGESATNTKKSKRYTVTLEEGHRIQFNFLEQIHVDKCLKKEFRSKFSFWSRLSDKF
jgi:hypothetical protein